MTTLELTPFGEPAPRPLRGRREGVRLLGFITAGAAGDARVRFATD